MDRLFTLSESRGKEASGFATMDCDEVVVYKSPEPASSLIKKRFYREHVDKLGSRDECDSVTIVGHSRLVTNGYEEDNRNNQPVIKSGMIGLHNGIIVNVQELWRKYQDEDKTSALDSEVIFTLLRRHYSTKKSLKTALRVLYNEIRGIASIAVLFADFKNLLLATNNGALYYAKSNDGNALVFASERYILHSLMRARNLAAYFQTENIRHLKSGQACLVDVETVEVDEDTIGSSQVSREFKNLKHLRSSSLSIKDCSAKLNGALSRNKVDGQELQVSVRHELVAHFSECEKRIHGLKRCIKCLLPETFPFITFDPDGVCNNCAHYQKSSVRGSNELARLIDPCRTTNGSYDCLVALSGGRDSCFTLHYVKKVLDLKPVVMTYDWGMVTDLARRNQSRICARLGVEHILVSADIRKKRESIRKNVEAWLKKPHLGAVPLFMAGDKQYFYNSYKIKEQTGAKMIMMGENPLEATGFKSGFSGVPNDSSDNMAYSISMSRKLKLASFYLKQFFKNPSYLNASIYDSLYAFFVYYLTPHAYINLYDYIEWDEDAINETLQEGYDWEVAVDTNSTWRIGDGTAPFYNYIYYTVAGFTENDTFRSNQIREGVMTREEAVKKLDEENQPRWQSIKWYCDTIGIDFEDTIKRINAIPKLYQYD
ncbi:hypothetical protein MJD09_14710 [bacterium]|nr:hypothetical protein [bacterium]